MNKYCWDIESYRNFFSVTYLPFDVNQKLVDAYIACDIARINAERKGLDATSIIEDKKKIMSAMGVRQYVIHDSPTKNHINQLYNIVDFHHQEKILYGYNSYIYDTPIMNYLLYHARKYKMSGLCKNSDNITLTSNLNAHGESAFKFGAGFEKTQDWLKFTKRRFRDKDLMKILYLDKTFTGLKAVAITMNWYRIQELPFNPKKIIQDEDVPLLLDYNLNDVLITLVLSRIVKSELDLREGLSKKFDMDLTNQSRSSIGKSLFVKYYEIFSKDSRREWLHKRTHRFKIKMHEILDTNIQFRSKNFRQLLKSIYNEVLDVEERAKFNKYIIINGKGYIMAKGGLHSDDMPAIFDNSDGYLYIDCDVESYYPAGILKLRAVPEHLKAAPFLATIHWTRDSRSHAKHKAKELKGKNDAEAADWNIEAEAMKISINRMYGGMGDVNDPLYDPKQVYKVTINLQLYLMMLIESLELAGLDVISANTDGLVTKMKPEDYDKYKAVCKDWETLTGFTLEFSEYEKYVRSNVNNYIAIKKGFRDEAALLPEDDEDSKKALEKKYIKRKGSYIYEPYFSKGFQHPIVSKAINEYFIYGTNYRDYITSHISKHRTNIYDFCISQKIGQDFSCELIKIIDGNLVKIPTQKYNRFYITFKDNPDGCLITKIKADKTISIRSGQNVIIFNDYFKEDDYKIDYSFYIKLVEEYLYGNKGRKRKIKRKDAGIFGNMNLLFEDYIDKNLKLDDETDFIYENDTDNVDIEETDDGEYNFDVVDYDDLPF